MSRASSGPAPKWDVRSRLIQSASERVSAPVEQEVQQRTDHAVVFIGCLGNAGHADQVPLHEQAADLTPGFPGPVPGPGTARIPRVGFAHAVQYPCRLALPAGNQSAMKPRIQCVLTP